MVVVVVDDNDDHHTEQSSTQATPHTPIPPHNQGKIVPKVLSNVLYYFFFTFTEEYAYRISTEGKG